MGRVSGEKGNLTRKFTLERTRGWRGGVGGIEGKEEDDARGRV